MPAPAWRMRRSLEESRERVVLDVIPLLTCMIPELGSSECHGSDVRISISAVVAGGSGGSPYVAA